VTDWSPADLATLAELAETFVRGGAVRRANLAAEGLSKAADRAQLRQLRLVLRLLESRAANLLVTGRPIAFRDRAPADRERVLLGWATSRLALRRSAFQAFRKLLTFLAYADPGPAGSANPLHAAIGYVPDRPPVTRGSEPLVGVTWASPDYFTTMTIALLRGRPFTVNDTAGKPTVVLISNTLARLLWGNEDPLGKTITMENGYGKNDFKVMGVIDESLGPSRLRGAASALSWLAHKAFAFPDGDRCASSPTLTRRPPSAR
jgi:hypothetical protein